MKNLTLEKLIKKIDFQFKYLEKIILNYDNDIIEFEDIEQLENEMLSYGLEEEEIQNYKIKKDILYITI